MAEVTNAVAPPQENVLGDITVVGKAVAPNADGEDRLKATDVIYKKITNDTEGYANTDFQTLPFIGALLRGDTRGMIRAYNGGETRRITGRHPTYGAYEVEYNERNAPTGRIFKNGKEVSATEANKINDAGGLYTMQDTTALQSGGFTAAQEIRKNMEQTLAKPIVDQYLIAQGVSQRGTTLRDAIDQRGMLNSNKAMLPVLTAISSLKPEQRKELFGFVSAQAGRTTGQTTEQTASKSGSATVGKNVQGTVGGNITGGVGSAIGGVAPPMGGAEGVAPGASIGVKAGRTAGSTNQATATGTEGQQIGTTGGTSSNIQTNVSSEVQKIIQMAAGSPEVFTGLQKYLQLSNVINSQVEEMDKISGDNQAPGVRKVAPLEPLMNSPRDVALYDNDVRRNNALTVAYAAFLAKKIHATHNKPDEKDINQWREEFTKSRFFKAANRTFDHESQMINGKKPELEDDAIYVDKNNKMRRWNARDKDWEPVNVQK
jgi:hypothetical protein